MQLSFCCSPKLYQCRVREWKFNCTSLTQGQFLHGSFSERWSLPLGTRCCWLSCPSMRSSMVALGHLRQGAAITATNNGSSRSSEMETLHMTKQKYPAEDRNPGKLNSNESVKKRLARKCIARISMFFFRRSVTFEQWAQVRKYLWGRYWSNHTHVMSCKYIAVHKPPAQSIGVYFFHHSFSPESHSERLGKHVASVQCPSPHAKVARFHCSKARTNHSFISHSRISFPMHTKETK